MSFLAPLFFAGLAALSIPVLIHLIQRERKNVVQFPSLMFVRRIPYSSIRRRRIHNWALLMLRLAALALIVIAFARPFLRSATLAAAAGGARDIVVLLDRSYSMGHGDQWTRAKRAASDAVAGMVNGDRATLVTFSTAAEVTVQPTGEQARLQSEIEATTLSASGTRFGPALKLAGSLLAASNFPRREVIIVSDFQRAGWTPGDGLRLPAGTTVKPLTVSATDTKNVAVTPVTLQRDAASGQDRVTVTGNVLNRSGDTIRDLAVSLEVDGHVAETATVTLEPHAAGSIVFKPVILTSPNTRGVVRIGADALAPDNAFHFVLSPPRPVPLTIVGGEGRGSRDQGLYLARALAIGESPKFEVATRSLDDLSDDILGRTRILVLNDASPAEPLSQRLRRFVEGGGGLLVILGPQSAWPQAAADYLPATPMGSYRPFARGRRRARNAGIRSHGVRAVSRAAERRLLGRALLWLSRGHAGQGCRSARPV